MQVSVVGLGKLGAPLVAVLATKGFDVIGVDRNPNQVAALQAGQAPVSEPDLQALITLAKARIEGTADIKRAIAASEATFVVVPTPSGADGSFSNAHVISAISEIGSALRHKDGYHLVVITSTVMPGSTGGPIRQALENASGRHVGDTLGLCYNPEFIALGSVIHDMLHPDFILIGESDPRAGDLLASIYDKVCDNRPQIRRMNFVNAEIAKIAVNSFVTAKISFANMISNVCDHLPGADASTVTKAIGCDTRIGSKYLAPALGYGGPCFPRDNAAFASLARRVGARADIAEATDAINRRQVTLVTGLVRRLLSHGTIGILGMSYKPNTAVIEESQGIAIAAELASDYRVIVFDPEAGDASESVLGGKAEVAASVESCAEIADLLIIATPWPDFKDIPRTALRRTNGRLIVIDCWRLLPPTEFAEIVDLVYLGKSARSESNPPAIVASA